MSQAQDLGAFDVSRETKAHLITYLELLEKWNRRINLVARSTLADAWTRHFVDSAQLFDLRPKEAQTWADLGSGGGFPGLVIAILAAEHAPSMAIHLVESDTRKCAFLRSVLRETGVKAYLHNVRIETLPPLGADVVSARALAPLPDLLGFAARHLAPGGVALFPKGADWKKEVEDARKRWKFSCEPHKSITDPKAVLLEIGGLAHV